MTRFITLPSRRFQSGQAAAEFAFVGIVFLGMMGGLVEMVYVTRAKHLLNMATFDAARTGSLNNATIAPMEITLENDMAALYMQTSTTQAGLTAAIASAQNVYNTMKTNGAPGFTPLTIISPSADMVSTKDGFGETQMIRLASQTAEQANVVIPNDNLQWRDRGTKGVTASNGAKVFVNVQDANILKIRVYWCQHLVVPGLDVVIHGIADQLPADNGEQAVCDTLTSQSQDDYYIALESDAVIQMQSPVVVDDGNLR